MHFEFAYKWVFFLIPLPIILYWVLPVFRKRRTGLIAPLFEKAIRISTQRPKKRAWISRRNIFDWIVGLVCWLCLIAALASPRYEGQPSKQIKTVRNFLIAADISFSMAQTDWVLQGKRTSRWDAVKTIMQDFIKNRHSDQIALVMFATHAYLQAPFTTDLQTVGWLMDQTEVGMAGQMTSIGDAIAYSIKVFKEDTVRQRVMLLLTDGIDGGQDISPLDAARAAKKDSIIIYTLGIGQARGDGGYDLDEKSLRTIANITGGRYFNAMNEGQLNEVYTTLDKLQPIEYQTETYRPVTLIYYYPLAAAVLLIMIYYLVVVFSHLLQNILRKKIAVNV